MSDIARIGILRGMENTFPEALITEINKRAKEQKLAVEADLVSLGGTRMGEASGYKLIFDRISH